MNTCNILALSGGGYKGLFSARVLSCLEKDFGCPIAKKFDLIAGTSIGGIIAIALALEIPAEEIEKLFIEKGNIIFKKRHFWSNGHFFNSKYNNLGLKDTLSVLFEDKTIGDLKHRIIITTVNYTEGKPQLFKTPHCAELCKDKNTKLIDVAMATSAAPTFFPIYHSTLGDFVDGGLVANHPGYFATIEAQKYLNQDIQNIHQLHIGTISQRFISSSSKWILTSSFLSWGAKLISLIFSCQENTAHFFLKYVLGDQYYSIDAETSDVQAKKIKLDAVSEKSKALLMQKAESAVQKFMGTENFKFLKNYSAPDFDSNCNDI